MAKPERGVKRYCGGCGARFYDLGRDPIICPKCGVTHDPVALAKSSRSKTSSAAAKPPPKPKPAPAEAAPAGEVSADSAEEALISDAGGGEASGDDDDDDAEEEEAVEDPSELGEDKDDMLEVIDNVAGDKEQET